MLSRRMNILLLGETGVGKSTFINMFGNYLSGKPLNEIASKNCNLLVPTKFSLMQENYVEEIVEIGYSKYEIPGTGSSATQRPQMYVFNHPEHNLVLNVIDTPGMGDTRGLEYDQRNAEMLLNYISELESIDAFCILLKPDVTRISVQFEFCLKYLLKQLDTSIVRNIMFVFTNGRMSHFTPGDTQLSLSTILGKIHRESGSMIPFTPSNSFCIDNESFKYIAGRYKKLQFKQNELKIYENSFDRSKNAIECLIVYVMTLKPAKMQGVATINESKRIIQRLIDPLLTLVVSYQNIIAKIQHYNDDLVKYKTDIKYLKRNMYKIEYEPVVMEQTVDTGKKYFNFCSNFNLTKLTWRSLLKEFKFAFNIFSDTKTSKNVELKERKVLDTDTVAYIKDRESAEKAVREKLDEMNEKCNEYEQEIGTVLTAIASFSIFIQTLQLISSQDHFEKIMRLIEQEYQEDNRNELQERITKCIKKYSRVKSRIGKVGAKDIVDCVNDLFSLQHSGHVFRKIIDEKINFDQVIFNQM